MSAYAQSGAARSGFITETPSSSSETPAALRARVAELEAENRRLRRRVRALEGNR